MIRKWGVFPDPDRCPACTKLSLRPTGKKYQYWKQRPSDASSVYEWKCSTRGCMYAMDYSIGRKRSGKPHTDPMYAKPADARGLKPGPGE